MERDSRFNPPLDLPAPEGREAEWALMRLARLAGVPLAESTWAEVGEKLAAKLAELPRRETVPGILPWWVV